MQKFNLANVSTALLSASPQGFGTLSPTTNELTQTKSGETAESDEWKREDSACCEATFSNDVDNMFSLTPAPFYGKGNQHVVSRREVCHLMARIFNNNNKDSLLN